MSLIFWRPSGGGSTTPPTAPTLAVVNNGDGTGAATVSSGDAGSENAIYAQLYGETTWTEYGTRTGNGAVSVDPPDGLYWWKCVATSGSMANVSNVVLRRITSAASNVRVDASLDDVLTATVAQLRAEIDGAEAENCYLVLNPDDVPQPTPGDVFYTVSPLSGNFREGMFSGGEKNQATVDTGIIVRCYSPAMLDQAQHEEYTLTHTTLGIIERQRQVLKALAGFDPTNDDDERLTAQPLFPVSQSYGRRDRAMAYAEVVFSIIFDWDLTS